MDESRVVVPGTRTSPRSAQEIAERIVRDAETRRTAKAATTIPDDPAPLSEALGIPTLLKDSKSAADGTKRREVEPSPADIKAKREESHPEENESFYLSSALGLPLLAKSPTPLSSALGLPTLLEDSKPN